MWILIDNYDSFTYILYHYLKEINEDILIFKNDQIDSIEIKDLNPKRIILSPGPKKPVDAGNLMSIIEEFHDKIPILGICLGHQALGQFFGCTLKKAIYPMHGKVSCIFHDNSVFFQNLPSKLNVMRYHSLVLTDLEDKNIIPLAFTDREELMAFKHKEYHCSGLQFHPESILTPHGSEMLKNWDRELKKLKL